MSKKPTDLEFKALTGSISGFSGKPDDIVDAAGFAGFMAKAYGVPLGVDLAVKPTKPAPHFKALEHTAGFLSKAFGEGSGKKPDYGYAGGMKIIAIGPKGGKIVGYDIHHQPIYAGTPKAAKLKSVADTVEKYGENTPDLHVLGKEWLEALGIHTPATTTKAAVISAQDGEKLLKEYGIKTTPLSIGQTAGVTWAEVVAHMGKPLVPHASKLTVAAHNLAAGVPDGKVFPEETFSTLKITGDLGGTHAPKKAVDASGNQFVWKTNKGDVVASWGEETFNKVASLVAVDPSIYPKAQVGELAGKTGVLLEFKESSGTLGSGAAGANVPEAALKKYAVQLARAHVLDWLMANHDAHGGNFLISPDGKKLFPVDKGQAFKWVGHDNLSTNYHPNEHEPVYNKLWKLMEDGKLDTVTTEAVVEAVREQIESIVHNLSLEQYQALVWPYVEEHDSKHNKDVLAKWKAIKARFTSLTSDWEGFLSKVTGKPISLKVKAPPALSVVEAKPPLASAVPMSLPFPGAASAPEQVVSAELYPSPELKVQQVPGWPQSKGTVTVHHPGAPVPPGVAWKAKFPGPGYKATVKYKGKPFTYAFHAKNGEMAIEVTFPDGSVHWASSPNEAADLPVLLEKGLPLTLTATEKKAAKIGYAANKLLKFDEFDFAGAASVAPAAELPEIAKTVQELEKEGKLIPGQATLHESTPLPVMPPAPLPSTASFVADAPAKVVTDPGMFSSWKSAGMAEAFLFTAKKNSTPSAGFHPPQGTLAHAVLPEGQHLLWKGTPGGKTVAHVFSANGTVLEPTIIESGEADILLVAKDIAHTVGTVSAPDIFAALNSVQAQPPAAMSSPTGTPMKALNLKLNAFGEVFPNHAWAEANKLATDLVVMTNEVNGPVEKWLPTDHAISLAPLPGGNFFVVAPNGNGFYAAVLDNEAGVLGEVEGTFAAPGGADSGSPQEGQTLSSLPVPEKFEAIAKKLEGYLPATVGLSAADIQGAIEAIAEKNDPGGSKPPQTKAEVKASHAPLSGIQGTPVHALGSFDEVLTNDPEAWKQLAASMLKGVKAQPVKHLMAAAPIAPGVIMASKVGDAGTVLGFVDEVGAPMFVFVSPAGKMTWSVSLASKDISNFISSHPGVDFTHLLSGVFALPGVQAAVKEIIAHAPVGVNAAAGVPHLVAPHVSNVVNQNGVVPPGKKVALAQVPVKEFAEKNLGQFLVAEGVVSGNVVVKVNLEPTKAGGDPGISVDVKLGNLVSGKTKVDVAAAMSKFFTKYGLSPLHVGATKMSGHGAYSYFSKAEIGKTISVETLVDDIIEVPAFAPGGNDLHGVPFSDEVVADIPVGEPFWMGVGGAKTKWKFVKDSSGTIVGEAGAPKPSSFGGLLVWSHPNAWVPKPGATFADIPVGAEFILHQAQPNGATKKVFAKKVATDSIVTDTLPAGAPSIKIPAGMSTFGAHTTPTLADLDSAPVGASITLDGLITDLGYKKGPSGWTGAGGAIVPPDVVLNALKTLHSDPEMAFSALKLILPETAKTKSLVEKFKKGAVVTKADLMAHAHELPVGKFLAFPKDVGFSGGSWNAYTLGTAAGGEQVWTYKYEGKVELPEGEYVCSGLSEGPKPDTIPKKVNKSASKTSKLALLSFELPIGTTLTLDGGLGSFTLTHYAEGAYDSGPTALWKDENGQYVTPTTLLDSYPKLTGQLTPPNGAPGIQAKAKSSVQLKAESAAQAPAVTAAAAKAAKPLDPAAIQKAKEWSSFVTTHAVKDDELLLALAKVQAAGFPGSSSSFAYEGDSGTVLVGTNHEDLNGITAAFVDALVGTKQTLAGTMLVLDKAKVKAKSAPKMIDGPDGKSYPEGTTFDVAQVHKTKKDTLAGLPGFKKTAPHQTEPTQKTVAKFEHTSPQTPAAQAEVKAKVEAAGIPVQDVAGNLSVVVTVANADLEKIESTQTVVTPHVPPLPVWKQSSPASAPALGPQPVGAPHVANKADLGAMAVIKPGVAGHFIRCGDPSVLADCRLQVKKVLGVGGKVSYEVFGTLTDTAETSLVIPAKHGKGGSLAFGVTSYDENHHDPETGYTKVKGSSGNKTARNATTENGSSASIVMSEDVYQRVFRITIPEGAPLEAEIAAGLTSLGLPTDKILADHAADPSLERRWMKQRILRQALGGAGVVTTQYASTAVADATKDEAKLDAMLVEKVGPGWKKVFDTAQVVVGAAGDATVSFKSAGVGEGVKGLVTQGVLNNVKFISSGVPTMDLVMFHLANGFQTSRKFGNLMGTGAPGASATQDETSGGAIGTFASVATDSTKSFTSCQSHSSQRLVYAPQVLESCLGHFADGDTYGKPVYGKPNRMAGDAVSSSNEWICHDYIPMEYAVGVSCETMMVKEAALKKWKKLYPERTQVNGIPIEDFFFVAGAGNDSNHIGHVMDKCKGLKMKKAGG